MLDVGCWMVDGGCWMVDVGWWMVDVGCCMLDVGCYWLVVCCWMLKFIFSFIGSWLLYVVENCWFMDFCLLVRSICKNQKS